MQIDILLELETESGEVGKALSKPSQVEFGVNLHWKDSGQMAFDSAVINTIYLFIRLLEISGSRILGIFNCSV